MQATGSDDEEVFENSASFDDVEIQVVAGELLRVKSGVGVLWDGGRWKKMEEDGGRWKKKKKMAED